MNLIDEHTRILAEFPMQREKEVVATILACLPPAAARRVIYDFLHGAPSLHLLDISLESCEYAAYSSFYRHITYDGLSQFLHCLSHTLAHNATIEEAYHAHTRPNDRYATAPLCRLFSTVVFLPSLRGTIPFFAYNHFLYLATYKTCIWKRPIPARRLIPCDHRILSRAYHEGVVTRRLAPRLKSAITLTDKAVAKYGEKEFYKLYEYLCDDK